MTTTSLNGGIFNRNVNDGGFRWNTGHIFNAKAQDENGEPIIPDKPINPKPEESEVKFNMAEFYSYEGLRNGGTFLVDDTTKTAVAANPLDIVGKVVVLTDNYTVGYGSAGDAPLGFVEQIENESNSNSEQLVVSVVWNQSREDIPLTGTVSAGNFAAGNGKGGLQSSSTYVGAKVYGSDNGVCTAYIGG